MAKNKSFLAISAVVVALVVLFLIPRFTNPSRPTIKAWSEARVGCLANHQKANLHIHPALQILIDGIPESLPAEIGIVRGCMAEIHTHKLNDRLHVESVEPGKTFTLGQFFTVWGREIERQGFTLKATVDGAPEDEIGNLILSDRQEILFEYTKEE